MNIKIENKNILITGAAGGIGKAIVQSFDDKGNKLLITGTNNEKLNSLSNSLTSISDVAICDLNDIKNIEKITDKIKTFFENKVDILINNAGITRDNIAIRMKEEQWLDVINVNLNSTFFLTKDVLKFMLKNRYGRIINISSIVGSSGNLGQSNYAASKAGVEGMTRSIALEVASRGITANCIAPGFIKTDMTKKLLELNEEKLLENIPIKRIGIPEDISSLTAFLASDNASYITGQTFHVNGGMMM
jgi:3-oxoacyl-[acyl-carrier protein] reductase